MMVPAQEPVEPRPSRVLIGATWQDAPHLTPAARATLLATIHPQFLSARTRGIPHIGAGLIYPVAETDIKVAPFELPEFWPRAFAMDTGGGAKPTAACWFARDPEAQIDYLYSTYKRSAAEPVIHADAIKARGAWIPGVGDCAALIVTQSDAEQLLEVYRRHGLDLELPDKGVESGIQETWEVLSGGRLKVFSSCENWFEEFRYYRRDKNGAVIKKNDHLLDATRYHVKSGHARMRVERPVVMRQKVRRDPFAGVGTPSGLGWMSS